jgi:hypothetical protein
MPRALLYLGVRIPSTTRIAYYGILRYNVLIPITATPHATEIPAMAPALSEIAPPFPPDAPPLAPPLAAPTPPTSDPVDSVSVIVGNDDDPVDDGEVPAVVVAASDCQGRAKKAMDRICIRNRSILVEKDYANAW